MLWAAISMKPPEIVPEPVVTGYYAGDESMECCFLLQSIEMPFS